MSSLTAPIAYVDPRRQLFVIERSGVHLAQTTPHDPTLFWGRWNVPPEEQSAWSWPTWSPDGKRLACFRMAKGEGSSAFVHVLDVGGVSAVELADLGKRLPIYLFWSPGGDRLAVLSQAEDILHLTAVSPDQIGHERHLAEGSPLFFTWATPSTGGVVTERVAAFVGSETGGRVCLIDPHGVAPIEQLPGVPGSFCSPLWVGDRLLYVAAQADNSPHRARSANSAALVAARPGSPDLEILEPVDGLTALVASPDGRKVARAFAPDGDGTPYRGLGYVDLDTGKVTSFGDDPCLAFTWAGESLVVARVDTDKNLLAWSRIDPDGHRQPLVETYPTRDLGFWLRFFEQYAQSHPIIDPTGQYLLLAGSLPGRGSDRDRSRLWQVSLANGNVDPIGEGLFAVYGPPELD